MWRLLSIFLFTIYGSLYTAIVPENVLICGVCKDVATRLPHTIQIIEKIGSLFKDYRVLIYENNSSDATKSILHKWTKKNSKVVAYTENVNNSSLAEEIININPDGTFFRPELIARARNKILDRAMSDSYKKYPYIIWMDLDFKIPPAFEGIVEVFQTGREWDAVLAYGVDPSGIFWDWFALRNAIDPLGPELLGNEEWYVPKHFSLSRNDDWYQVYSAFGGCGIYKKSSIEGCRYSAVVTQDLEKSAQDIIEQGKLTNHPAIVKYLLGLKKLQKQIILSSPTPHLSQIKDSLTGIVLFNCPNSLIWKMNSFTYQYPVVCEHVPFHASMIVKGHGKIFINPRMVFIYGG